MRMNPVVWRTGSEVPALRGRTARARITRLAVAAVVMSALSPATTRAQGGDGFLFRQPRVTVEFETGYAFQRAGGDLFDQVIAEHTVGRRDFDSPYLGGELGIRVTEHWDVALNVGYQSATVDSEYREFVGSDDLPILQVNDFGLVTASVGGKYYPLERGRRIGRFAWIPRKVAPFFGAGIGVASYSFEQSGEFVDYDTLEIYDDRLRTDRDGFLARVGAGVNISLGQQFLFTAESRYSWSSADVGGAYGGFGDVDLSGLQLVGGIAVRF